MDTKFSPEAIALLRSVRERLKVTKVVCTRTMKGRGGETFVGFSAAWNSVQEDGGQGLVHVGVDEADPQVQGMSLKESKMAAHLLGLHVDTVAFEHATANGSLSLDELERGKKALNHNYAQLLSVLLDKE